MGNELDSLMSRAIHFGIPLDILPELREQFSLEQWRTLVLALEGAYKSGQRDAAEAISADIAKKYNV